MLIIIGGLIVLAATLGGFMMAGGHLAALVNVSEIVVILGVTLGAVIIATPLHVLKDLAGKILGLLQGKTITTKHYFELISAMFEIFQVGRRSGLLAIEEHLSAPRESAILKKYPTLLENEERLSFLVDSLKPVVDGRIKPDQLKAVLDTDIETKAHEADHAVHVLTFAGDSLPGIGIVAAVLGIIHTMSILDQGAEKVGASIAGALSGTMLGVFCAYGFANPLAGRLRSASEGQLQYFRCIKVGVIAFATGMAPLTAAELARRVLDHSVQPGADALETALQTAGIGGGAK